MYSFIIKKNEQGYHFFKQVRLELVSFYERHATIGIEDVLYIVVEATFPEMVEAIRLLNNNEYINWMDNVYPTEPGGWNV